MKNFGQFQLFEELGKGPTGTTYRAHDTVRECDLALKVLHPVTISADSKDSFRRDLAACATLQHPHIVSIRDSGEVDGAIYIATELLKGTDLSRCIHEGAALPLARKLRLIAQVCDGLAYAHGRKLVHGDIKPSNIFLTEDKNAKLLDFGIAKWPASPLPNYLAPEQILDEPSDRRSDLFSVAVVLYEFLTGAYPFQASAGLIPREIVHTQPQPMRKLKPEIPDALESLMLRALQKNLEQRFQTAEELAVSLSSIAQQLEAEQIVAAPPPLVAAPPAPPVAVLAAAAAGTPGGASVQASVTRLSAQIVENSVVKTKAPAPSRKRVPAIVAAAVLGISGLLVLLSRDSSHAAPTKVQSEATVRSETHQQPSSDVQEQPVRVEIAKPKRLAGQVLRGQVSVLWEAGEYAQAMKLVDAILADDPTQAEARAWKQKIRAAQEAEGALK